MKHKHIIHIFIYLILGFVFTSGPLTASSMVAVKADKIVTVSGDTIVNGTILIEGPRITAVGANVHIPQGCEVLEYPGCTIYPGLFNGMCTLGISGIPSVEEWDDSFESGDYNPHVSAFTAFYSWSRLIPILRDFGTLTVLTAPSGGIIPGKAVLAQLDGWTPEDMFLRQEAALIVQLPSSPKKNNKTAGKTTKTKKSKHEKKLDSFFSRAHKYYLKYYANGNTQNVPGIEFDVRLDAMKELWSDNMPVIISAATEANIKYAIQLGKKYKLNVILTGIYEGEALLDEIKASGYPVLLSSMYTPNKDWEDGYDKYLRLPGQLESKKIPIMFSAPWTPNAFDLPVMAGRAVAYGLSPEEALKGLTLYPARIFKLNDLGSIEKGKIANLVIADGNILETSTVVKDVFIKGKKIHPNNYFQEQYKQARDRAPGEINTESK